MKVKFNNRNGSIGDIIECNGNNHTVKWYYGKDVKGGDITSISYYVKGSELLVIPDRLYSEYINCRAWSDEQKVIDDKIWESISGK